MIADLTCGGNVSNAEATPERINVADDEENEFVALFRTSSLMLSYKDTAIVCEGTLDNGTTFTGMDGTRVIRDIDGNRCEKRRGGGDNDDDED